jgi:Acyl-CoA synthetases (AMP-forming)/AMP-acid ligases II
MGNDVPLAAKRTDIEAEENLSRPLTPTPTSSGLPFRCDFRSLAEALDYAATGRSGLNFYSGRLDLVKTVPYRELREQAVAMARRMMRVGLRPGDRVALIADTDADFVRAFAACQYAGLIPAPLPLPLAFGGRDGYVAQIRHMMVEAKVGAALSPEWLQAWLEEAAKGLDLKFCGTAAQMDLLPELAADLPPVNTEGLSYLQFSSGSTRAPTGVAITHHALMSNTAAIVRHGLAVREGDRAVSWLPFYHDMGLVGFVLSPIVSQLSVDYMATRDFARRPLGWLSLMASNSGTIAFSPSFGYELCTKRAATGALPDLDLSRWRVAGIGGDMIRPQMLERFIDTFGPLGFQPGAFVPSYGMAETTLAVTFRELGQGVRIDRVDSVLLENERRAVPADGATARTRDFVTCGRVIPDHSLEVRDDDGVLLGEREVGHVFVRGPSLMTGYDHRPDETRQVLAGDGWLATGDLGYMIGEELVITGRSKDIIIINGRNLWPQDLEFTAEQVEGVRHGDAAAFSLDQAEEERVMVLIQCRASAPEARRILVQSVTATLRKVHGIEPHVALVPNNALPMTSSGKLSRTGARKAYLAGHFDLETAI